MLINTVGTYVTRPDITIAVTMDSVRYHWYWGARLRKGATANLIIRLTNAAGGDVLVVWGVQSAQVRWMDRTEIRSLEQYVGHGSSTTPVRLDSLAEFQFRYVKGNLPITNARYSNNMQSA